MEKGTGKREGLAGAAVESAERLEGATSLMRLLEEKSETVEGVGAAEIAAVRCVVDSCAGALDAAWQQE